MEAPTLRIDAVLIESGDHLALAGFYRAAFDLPAPIPSGADHTGFPLANTYLGFDRVERDVPGERGRTSVWFRVANVEAAYERLRALGASERTLPCVEPNGEHLATLFDPEGNIIGLLAE